LRPTPWNPGANADVQELRATPAGLVVYGEFDELAGVQHRGLGVFPLAGSGDAYHQRTPRWLEPAQPWLSPGEPPS
jgi:hypothetical protein